jgi:hypothetical protein
MWSRLDDALLDHRKLFLAGQIIGGYNGMGLALALYVAGLLYSNRHLTDGHLDVAVVRGMPHIRRSLDVADALVQVGLWERNDRGFVIHDFKDYNFSAEQVAERKRQQNERKHRSRLRK